jgi:hypothetical protein
MQKRYMKAGIQNGSRQTDMQVDKDRTQNCDLAAGKETKMRASRQEDLDGGIVQQTAEIYGKNRRAGRLTYKQSCGWAER